MSTIKSNRQMQRLVNICKVWSTDHRKATCTLYNEHGFHPDRSVPSKCVGKTTRKY